MNAPNLRFRGFKDEWKKVNFKNLFSERNVKTGEIEKYPLYSLTVSEGIVPKTDRYKRDFLVKKEDNFKVVYPNDFVSNPMNMTIGALDLYKGEKTVSVSGYYNVFTNDSSYRNYFLANYLTSEKMIWRYKSIATGSLIEKQRVHYSQFIELQELLPSVEEAMQISNFLELLDKRIYRQQEKVHLLKEQKKGYMQKIFKQEIRFKDDDGGDYPEWEVYKLKDFVERVNRKNGENMTNHPLTISAQFGLVDQMEYFNKKVASESLTGYYLLRKGEFAYNKSYSKGYPYGAIKRLDRYEHGALSTLYICFSPNKNVLSDFLVQYFDSSAWYREVSMVSVEGARNHGLLNVSVTDFFETNHKLPSLEEQIKISNFLSELDDKLQLEQQKLEALQQQKKGFMQQMFI
ncbi:restriction endonuclease subunit S [Bacillus cereus group sp. BceL216]|uniref:restriction endonuclease subunit S n=5 Tax=Bacillus TaxID=1386 RepID=UPI0022E80BC6|nr:restriction endonuclease subunit S [Bacillus cereus]MDF9630510.1 restriction endonuclease subunit S [Bacillus cereus]MDF9635150.1 restriction endonuclease subunit S [Bacillus cereus]MDG1583614.1 restriction endonuclease subunit S [Bacillus cereus]MDZ4503320.1 restriction endonuclease subunit S [Bacillus cereus]WKT32998.1 restriction endonuclease subunit S [Bacillus cereus]